MDNQKQNDHSEFLVGGPSPSEKRHRKSKIETSTPIDESEQNEIIRKLRVDAKAQGDHARNIFHGLYWIIAAVYSMLFLYSKVLPYTIDHQKYFMHIVSLETFQVFYVASTINFLLLASLVKVNIIINKLYKRYVYSQILYPQSVYRIV